MAHSEKTTWGTDSADAPELARLNMLRIMLASTGNKLESIFSWVSLAAGLSNGFIVSWVPNTSESTPGGFVDVISVNG
jgi:hypothetical protein